MKKYLIGGLFSLVAFGAIAGFKPVSANEGIVNLRGAGGACFASSIYIDGSYRVMGTCRDLKMALTPEKNRYVVWQTDETGKNLRRLSEVQNGKFASATDIRFIRLFITAEIDNYGNKPSEDLLLTGDVQSINFGAGIEGGGPIATPTPTPTKVGSVEVTPAAGEKVEVPNAGGLGTVLATVFKVALLGFGVLLVIVGVFSFLSRKRGL